MSFYNNPATIVALKGIISALETPAIRYKGLVLSTKNQKDLMQLTSILRQELRGYEIWIDNEGDQTPEIRVSRSQFNSLVFEKKYKGLLIVSPEEWMYDWKILDKKSFYSALSETYGGHVVLVLAVESTEFKKLITQYFRTERDESIPFQIHFSKYQQSN